MRGMGLTTMNRRPARFGSRASSGTASGASAGAASRLSPGER